MGLLLIILKSVIKINGLTMINDGYEWLLLINSCFNGGNY